MLTLNSKLQFKLKDIAQSRATDSLNGFDEYQRNKILGILKTTFFQH